MSPAPRTGKRRAATRAEAAPQAAMPPPRRARMDAGGTGAQFAASCGAWDEQTVSGWARQTLSRVPAVVAFDQVKRPR